MVLLKLLTLLLVVSTVIPSVAHALELPGKMRLTREQYLTVQPIYYPGFTVVGTAEPLSIVMLIVLLSLTPGRTATFWLIAAALVGMVITHILYWVLTAPANKVWLRNQHLAGGAQRFFGTGGNANEADWTMLRDRWERSHLYRAMTSVSTLVLLAIALLRPV